MSPPVGQKAVIVGFGPVGQTAAAILQNFGVQQVVIDLNLDTVRELTASGKLAIYGDASLTKPLDPDLLAALLESPQTFSDDM